MNERNGNRPESCATADSGPQSTTGAPLDAVQTETELRRSQSLRQIVGRIAKIGGWELDLVTNEHFWSDDARQIFERDAGTALDIEAVYAMHDADARQQLMQAVESARQQGHPWDLTLPATTPSGRRVWVRSIGVPEFEAGKPVRISGAVQDVTDVRATEESRAELLERLALATSAAGIGIFDWYVVARTRTWDKRNCQLWGVPCTRSSTRTTSSACATISITP
jgi:diguanylate cyclase